MTYKKGCEMYLTNALCRACAQSYVTENTIGNDEKDNQNINMVQYLTVSESTQNAIRTATES